MRDAGQISNELEYIVCGVDAEGVIETCGLPVLYEVNQRDILELNVSLAKDISELNANVRSLTSELMKAAKEVKGTMHGGSSVLADVTALEPRRYRTTSLSESCARNLLDITSQQIVLGVTDESLGFELYNLFRNINPVLLALTASSPYRFAEGKLEDTGLLSRRPEKYEAICRHFPKDMLMMKPLASLEEYLAELRAISDEVNRRLKSGELDANLEELRKIRSNDGRAYSYIPFDCLAPHQIYWPNRIRPDHRTIEKGGSSVFSLELRIPDLPTTVSRIQMLNSFVVGLAYYVADHGADDIPAPFNASHDDLKATAMDGLHAKINGNDVWRVAQALAAYAERGLKERGHRMECELLGRRLERVLKHGNDAELIRKAEFINPDELREYLVGRLAADEE